MEGSKAHSRLKGVEWGRCGRGGEGVGWGGGRRGRLE